MNPQYRDDNVSAAADIMSDYSFGNDDTFSLFGGANDDEQFGTLLSPNSPSRPAYDDVNAVPSSPCGVPPYSDPSFDWLKDADFPLNFTDQDPALMDTRNDFLPTIGENILPSFSGELQTEALADSKSSYAPRRVPDKEKRPGTHRSRPSNFVPIKELKLSIGDISVTAIAKPSQLSQKLYDSASLLSNTPASPKNDATESAPVAPRKEAKKVKKAGGSAVKTAQRIRKFHSEALSKEARANEVLGPNTSVRRMFLEEFLPHINSLGSIQIQTPNPSAISRNIDGESLSAFFQKIDAWISTRNTTGNWVIGTVDIFCSLLDYCPLPEKLKLKPKRSKITVAQREDRKSKLVESILNRMESYSFKKSSVFSIVHQSSDGQGEKISPGERLLESLFCILLKNVILEENANNSFEDICQRLFKNSYCPFCGYHSDKENPGKRGQSSASSTVKRHLAMGNASQTQYAHFVHDE